MDLPHIRHIVPEPRLARYRDAVDGNDDALHGFYLWCQRLSLALFADIATLEVALRSAIARELVAEYGVQWYARRDLFDDDGTRAISAAWRQAGLQQLRDDPSIGEEVIEGKLVAALTFGFWVKLLGRGSYAGTQPLRTRRIYDTLLWRPALSKALPHAPSRRDAEHAGSIVRAARNRIAHHEHIAWGIPLPGQQRRLTVRQVHADLCLLAGFISREALVWVAATTELGTTIEGCPIDSARLALG